YAVIVTNSYGSITSSVVLNVLPSPPVIVQQPRSLTRFAGAFYTMSVGAIGSARLSYQWKLGGVAVPCATLSRYTNVGASSNSGNYSCTISNSLGTTNTALASLAVLPLPADYVSNIVADIPMAYWRFGETNGTTAYDYVGGHDGQYIAVALTQSGYSAMDR